MSDTSPSRLEALRPDAEKIHALADALEAVAFPEVATQDAIDFLAETGADLRELCNRLRDFGTETDG